MRRQERLVEYRITEHARMEMLRRQISEQDIARVLSNPEQVFQVRQSRIIYQSRIKHGSPIKTYLLRVFVDIDRKPPEVVTVYRTGKVEKYWKGEL